MLNYLKTFQIRHYNKCLIILSNYKSYLIAPDLQFFGIYYNLYKELYITRGNVATNSKIINTINKISSLYIIEIENKINLSSINDKSIFKKTENLLENLIKEMDNKLIIPSIKASILKVDKGIENNWNSNFELFISMDILIQDLIKKLINHKKPVDKKLYNEYMVILFSSYQEFYHSMSHLFLSDKNCIEDGVKKSTSHLQRASLDLAKKGVDLIKKYSFNTIGLDCRTKELNNISNNDKDQILKCYINKINRVLAS